MVVKVKEYKDFCDMKDGETFEFKDAYYMKIGMYKAVNLSDGDVVTMEYYETVEPIALMVVRSDKNG